MLLVESACQGMAALVVHAGRSSVISLDPTTSAGQTAAIDGQGRPCPPVGQLKFSKATGLPAAEAAPTLNPMDKLEEIFRMQDALNKRIGVNLPPASEEEKTKWILNYTRAMQQETAELIDSVPWKWWAKYQKFDEQNAKVEVVDLFHFLVSLAQTLGMTPDDVYQAYLKKNAVNHQRQESGYVKKDEADSKHI